MSPEAVELAKSRARISVRESARAYRVATGKERARHAASGAFQSAHAAIFRDMGRDELAKRARLALEAFMRLVDLDDAEPSEDTQSLGMEVVRWVVHDLSKDVDEPMLKAEELMRTGRQLTLSDARAEITSDIELELRTQLFGRRRSRLPIQELLRAPRYIAVATQLKKAQELSEGPNPDYANALKDGVAAIESLARIVTPGEPSTLGDALKKLRSARTMPAGLDKMIEGISTYVNNLPGVRHGQTVHYVISADEWAICLPLIMSGIHALLQLDSSMPV